WNQIAPGTQAEVFVKDSRSGQRKWVKGTVTSRSGDQVKVQLPEGFEPFEGHVSHLNLTPKEFDGFKIGQTVTVKAVRKNTQKLETVSAVIRNVGNDGYFSLIFPDEEKYELGSQYATPDSLVQQGNPRALSGANP